MLPLARQLAMLASTLYEHDPCSRGAAGRRLYADQAPYLPGFQWTAVVHGHDGLLLNRYGIGAIRSVVGPCGHATNGPKPSVNRSVLYNNRRSAVT